MNFITIDKKKDDSFTTATTTAMTSIESETNFTHDSNE